MKELIESMSGNAYMVYVADLKDILLSYMIRERKIMLDELNMNLEILENELEEAQEAYEMSNSWEHRKYLYMVELSAWKKE